MNFGQIVYHSRGVDNLGDNMQLIALDYLYSLMHVTKVVLIQKNKLASYDGVEVILPIVMPLLDYVDGGFSNYFSSKITPIFISLTLVKDRLSDSDIAFFQKTGPVGCRDERTFQTMRRYQIPAYLAGCITAILPPRSLSGGRNKVFLVDVDQRLVDRIPKKLLNNAEFMTHTRHQVKDPKHAMRDLYELYKSDASLIITSLLHCAVPAVAANIPIILAPRSISYRFGWLERLLPIYDEKNWNNIDWNPKPLEYPELKKILIDFMCDRIKGSDKGEKLGQLISQIYLDRNKNNYINDAFDPAREKIDRLFQSLRNPEINYSFWGMTQISEMLFDYIRSQYPKASLVAIYDSFKEYTFNGLVSKSPDKIDGQSKEIVIVTSFSGHSAANELFSKMPGKRFVICWERL